MSAQLEVFNCWLNLVDSYLDDENQLPFKVIASFSASRFAMLSIHLIVLHRLSFGPWFQQKLSVFLLCADAVLDVVIQYWQFSGVGSLLRRSSCLSITSRISADTVSSWTLCCPVWIWCDGALSTEDLLISVAVCWKTTLGQGGLYLLYVYGLGRIF